MALDLLLQCRLGPVRDAARVAAGHVDELLREVELDLQVLPRHVLENQLDVATDRVVVGGVGGGPVGLLEEVGDRAARAGERDLEAHAFGHDALVAQPLEDLVGLDGDRAVAGGLEAQILARA